MLKPRLLVLLSMVFAAAMSRLIPHPPNMTSIAAVALFGGAYFSDKRLAFAVPVAALFLSDLVLGLYRHMEVVYLSFALVVLIGAGLPAASHCAVCRGRGRVELRALFRDHEFRCLGI